MPLLFDNTPWPVSLLNPANSQRRPRTQESGPSSDAALDPKRVQAWMYSMLVSYKKLAEFKLVNNTPGSVTGMILQMGFKM
jgi:hypothetical protein